MKQEFNDTVEGGVAGRDVIHQPGSGTTMHFNAPVFGPVVGGDYFHGAPSDFGSSVPPPPAPPSLSQLQQRLAAARAELWRKTLAFYVNWPSALMVLGSSGMLMYIGWIVSTRRLLQADAIPMPFFFGVMATMLVLAMWLNATRRSLRHVLDDLRSEVHALERAVALSRAGRL